MTIRANYFHLRRIYPRHLNFDLERTT